MARTWSLAAFRFENSDLTMNHKQLMRVRVQATRGVILCFPLVSYNYVGRYGSISLTTVD